MRKSVLGARLLGDKISQSEIVLPSFQDIAPSSLFAIEDCIGLSQEHLFNGIRIETIESDLVKLPIVRTPVGSASLAT